jgi:hypothetical protein
MTTCSLRRTAVNRWVAGGGEREERKGGREGGKVWLLNMTTCSLRRTAVNRWVECLFKRAGRGKERGRRRGGEEGVRERGLRQKEQFR